ncbi:hypothetical protein SAMN05216474_1858 [Lishizhenia tianjinensis]|uniref:Lysylphosphatidylglycerol synthase TM region n=1 Tax=Lishizhenia tianjinensis TaxID=477690 RepID=A0A1I7A3A0_9FLAO|nr:hypothetical protein SAMN05216474_1858 [Lishizhenia tianjinensis]
MLLQIPLFFLLLWIFYDKFSSFQWSDIKSLSLYNPLLLIIGVLLMPLNWYLEALKIKMNAAQIKEEEHFSFRAVLASVFMGVITPNRLGNFLGARLWFQNKQAYTSLNLYANLSQFIATLILGGVGLIFLEVIPFNLPAPLLYSCIVIALVSYFSIPKIRFKQWRLLKEYRIEITPKHRGSLLGLSLLRTVIISVQYTCFLLALNEGAFQTLFLWSTVFYFYLTLIPSWFLNRLVVRESLALVMFLPLLDNSLGIVFSSLLIWLVNLGLPAIVGAYFTYKRKAYDSSIL